MEQGQCAKELVSIIVPVYNVAPYIRKCIESIQRQTYQKIEIIVVDDGSVDCSGEICEDMAMHDSRIKMIRQENAGVVTARCRGVEGADGKYIMFIDGDDWIEPAMVEVLLNEIVSSDLVTSGVYYQEAMNRTVERYDGFREGRYRGEGQMDELLKSMLYDADLECVQRLTPWGVNKIFRSELVREIYKGLDSDITFAEDSVFLYKYLLHCQSVSIIHQCYYHYRYRPESAMHAVNRRMLMDINKVYLALESDFRKHRMGESLLYQLQRWVMIMSCRAINSHMGFCSQAHVPEYIADAGGLQDKKIILYGAGKVGQDTYSQLRRFHYQVILWVDKNYCFYQEKGLPVVSPDEIFDKDYDAVMIAVKEQEMANTIRTELCDRGISDSVVLWNQPIRVFD